MGNAPSGKQDVGKCVSSRSGGAAVHKLEEQFVTEAVRSKRVKTEQHRAS